MSGFSSIKGREFAVTGGSGFVGRRLVEMLVERGAKRVVSLDIREPLTKKYPHFNMLSAEQEQKVEYVLGDISNEKTVVDAFRGVQAVFHIAAAVGPFLPQPVFEKVNVVGTKNVLTACRENGITQLVASSTPSIFFNGKNIAGAKPSELKICKEGEFLATYAATKAVAERLVREANSPPKLMTINIAPHQVYGPRDTLFLPNFMANRDRLRIMGDGKNRVSTTYVDNYCHGLMQGLDALVPGHVSLGKFYLVCDDGSQPFWKMLDRVVVRGGAPSLFSKWKVPTPVMYTVAYALQFLGWLTNTQFRLIPFNVTMLTIDRYFNVDDAKRDFGYQPLKTFEEGFEETLQWYQDKQDFVNECAKASLGK